MAKLNPKTSSALAVILAFAPVASFAQGEMDIDIPSQSLASAVTELGQETGLNVSVAEALVVGRTSPAVKGSMTPMEALNRLLAGTGLSPVDVQNGNVAVTSNFASQNATDDPFDLDTLVLTLDRFPTTATDLASSTTILEDEDVEEQPSFETQPLDGLARVVPGIQLNAPFGQRPRLRGRDPAFRINGVDVLSRSLPNRADIQSFAGGGFDRIEVLRGADATFGQGATGGSINFNTPRPVPGEIQQEATFGLSFAIDGDGPDRSTERLRYSSTGTAGELDFYLGIGIASFGTEFDANGRPIADDTLVPTRNADQVDLNFTLERDIDGVSRVSTSHYINYNFTDARTFLVQTDADPVNGIGSTALPNPGTLDTESDRLDYVGTLTYLHDDLFGSEAQITLFGQLQDIDEFGAGFRALRRHGKLGFNSSFRTPVVAGANVTWGLDYEYSFGDTQQLGFPGSGIAPGPFQAGLDTHNIAPFVQLEAPLSDRLTFEVGVRYEYFNTEVDSVANRVLGRPDFTGGSLSYDQTLFNASLTYEVSDRLEVYGAFSQALDVLNIGAATTASGVSNVSEINPEPSATDQFELGARGSSSDVQWTAAIFYSQSDRATSFTVVPDSTTPSGITTVQNREERELYGLEATLDWQISDRLALGGYVAITDGNFTNAAGESSSIRWSEALPLTIAPYIEYQTTDRLFLKAQAVHQVATGGGRTDSAGAVLNGTDAVTFVDLFARYDLNNGSINFGVENALDEFGFAILESEINLARTVPYEGRRFSVSYNHRW